MFFPSLLVLFLTFSRQFLFFTLLCSQNILFLAERWFKDKYSQTDIMIDGKLSLEVLGPMGWLFFCQILNFSFEDRKSSTIPTFFKNVHTYNKLAFWVNVYYHFWLLLSYFLFCQIISIANCIKPLDWDNRPQERKEKFVFNLTQFPADKFGHSH